MSRKVFFLSLPPLPLCFFVLFLLSFDTATSHKRTAELRNKKLTDIFDYAKIQFCLIQNFIPFPRNEGYFDVSVFVGTCCRCHRGCTHGRGSGPRIRWCVTYHIISYYINISGISHFHFSFVALHQL